MVLLNQDDWNIFKNFRLITAKPMLYICNVSENDISGNQYTKLVIEKAKEENIKCLIISAKIEEEIANMKEISKEDILNLGLTESGLNQIIRESSKLLGLLTFYTVGPNG
jgi:ribosome-binding ATPase YchF (GTP1/OBG family)